VDGSIDCPGVEFEKWQALGNDYVIVEDEALGFELSPERIRALCARGTGVGSDGILVVSRDVEAGCLARLRIFNPDGSEAEVSGNGAREAVLYMRRRGWAESDTFSIQTAAGELRPTIKSATTATIDMGQARLRSDDYPTGTDNGRGELTARGQSWRFQHVQVGNPQCVIPMDDPERLEALDLHELGPPIEHHELFPHRTNVSWFTEIQPSRIRARIFERGAGETSASGTGASGAAVAYALEGGSSPVTVVLDGGELEVEVGEDLRIALTGWAAPVYRGALAEDFLEELRALE